MNFDLGRKRIGPGQPTFITFEIGPTHCGFESAKRLITASAEAGADAVKVQILDPERLISDRNQLFEYGILLPDGKSIENVTEPLYDLMVRRSMSKDEWRELKQHADKVEIDLFATVAFEDELDLIADAGFDSVKIASADLNHHSFIKKAAETGLCVQLDTGMATLDEVAEAVEIIESSGNTRIIIHHCPSGYPASATNVNLNILKALQERFHYPVAFSDHSPGFIMDVAAIGIGASMVEKTITENKFTRSVEHVMSLDLAELKEFVTTVRELDSAFGVADRTLTPSQIMSRDSVRRSAFLCTPVKSGDFITEEKIIFRRPGYGITPTEFSNVIGKRFSMDIEAGTMLSKNHISGT